MGIIRNKKGQNRSFSLCNFFPKNHKGWLEIVEAFVSVLLVATVLLIILNTGGFKKTDLSDQVYNIEISIIREIQTTDSLRKEIADVSGLPVGWEKFPQNVKSKIIERTPDYLTCVGKICELSKPCSLSESEGSEGKDIYSESGVISTTLTGAGASGIVTVSSGAVTDISITDGGSGYTEGESATISEVYKQLNLFCWTKG